MAHSFDISLTNTRGLGKIIFFKGLDFPMVITPSLLGEPILTAQPFYFIERMDCVARIRFEKPEDIPKYNDQKELDRIIEYTIDNYLFEFSKKYPELKITSKISEFVYWMNDPNYHYFQYDWRLSELLILDTLNDESIINCSDKYRDTIGEFNDWCLFKNDFNSLYEGYVNKLNEAMKNNVHVETTGHSSLNSGKYLLPIIKTASKPLTLHQAEMFGVVEPHGYQNKNVLYNVNRGIKMESDFDIPQEIIESKYYYNPELLAYFFSALRDSSPISEFKNYYNVLEYFFEEAPFKLGINAKYEYEQIVAVLRWVTNEKDLRDKINAQPKPYLVELQKDQKTSSGESIKALNLVCADLLNDFGAYLYSIRNACIHSKKTRRGKTTSRFVPSTDEEMLLRIVNPIIQWIATKCIEIDK